MPKITFSDVSKSYDKVQPLQAVSFSIEPGEFFVLVGPSGSGKSTLLRMIAGLESITAGTLSFDDTVVNDVASRDRDVGMVFQNYALYPHLTVAENLAFPLSIRREPRDEVARKVKDIARMLNMEDLLDRKPKQLSGGQRQRVAVGRAIIRKPKVFLFDEPLSNLDAQLRVHMRTELRQLQRQLGITTVYVTHDQVEAMTMADRMAILNGGRLQQIATPQEVYERPATVFVARFCGSPSMNIVAPASVSVGVGAQHLPWDRAAFAGLRPEDVRYISSDAGTDVTMTGTLVSVEFLGHEWLSFVKCKDDTVCIRSLTRPDAPLDTLVRIGADARHIHLFDDAERRLS